MKGKVKVKSLSRVRLFATPWTAAYQAPPAMGFSRQEYWSGVPLPSLFIHPICWELKELHFYGGIKIAGRNINNLRYADLRYGEGNGTPLQYSCLENPTDGGAW